MTPGPSVSSWPSRPGMTTSETHKRVLTLADLGAGQRDRTTDRPFTRSTASARRTLAAQMTPVIALMALAAPGLSEAPVHERRQMISVAVT